MESEGSVSVWCQCAHHVEFHEQSIGTVFWSDFPYKTYCRHKDKDGKFVDCQCKEFVPYKNDF